MISFQIKPWVAFGLPYLLIELFYIGRPVVRMDGRSLGVRSRDYQISLAVELRYEYGVGSAAMSLTKIGEPTF